MATVWLVVALCLSAVEEISGTGLTKCYFYKNDVVKYSTVPSPPPENKNGHNHSRAEDYADSNTTELCLKGSDFCYSLWQVDPQNKSIIFLSQGCWDSSGDAECGLSSCISTKKRPKALNNTKFCCCSGDFCNVNVTDGYVPISESTIATSTAIHHVVEHASYTLQTVAISLSSVLSLAFLIIVAFILYRLYYNRCKTSSDSLHLMEAPPPLSPTFDIDSLKIQETVGRGRYGYVCRGTLHDRFVAVKIFGYQNRQYFINEREIYTLPHMEHNSLPKFIGSEERPGADGRPEYLLVVSYSPCGCLQDFLRNTTVDWGKLCKMALSITRGLAHLHTEIGKGGKLKPCIAHRDLTSRNVLVKTDGTCMLCDFGFAIRISGSKYYQNGEEQIAETTSLADVGTLRYMAPEILEGAVNLRDCESSLKQIDVYALGLVLWEIATRCSDLFQGMDVPEYKLPFEAEIGTHPSMEQMQVLVTRHKARPLFPDIWKDTNPAVRALKETIEDCWDQDAEARLTTLCVEERISELPVMWERYKAGLSVPGVSPTVNPTSNHQRTSAPAVLSQAAREGDNTVVEETLNNNVDLQPYRRERVCSVSEATTETLLSPSEPLPQNNSSNNNPVGNSKNSVANNSSLSSKVTVPLQPHQGRNPCMERNLMVEPLDDVAVSGNTLLDRESRLSVDRVVRSLSDGDTDIFDSLNVPDGLESNALVSSDVLNHSTRVCNPIPYLQNAVHLASTIPKQPNVPGNGHSLRGHDPSSKIKEDKRWGPLNFFDRRRNAREGGIKAGLKSLLERKSTSTNKALSEEQQPLKGSIGNGYSPSTPGVMDGKIGQTNPVNLYWTCDESKESDRLVDTEVCIIKSDCSTTVVRPLNNGHINTAEGKEEFTKSHEIHIPNGHAKVMKANENDTENETYQKKNMIQDKITTTDKSKRPTSLPVQRYQNGYIEDSDLVENSDHESTKETTEQDWENNNPVVLMRRKGSNGRRKGVKRVKTPFEIKGRFSLYDDRIMSSQELATNNSKIGIQPKLNGASKFSVSVPLDMDTLCVSQTVNLAQKDQEAAVKLQASNVNGIKLPYKSQLQTVHTLCDI